MQVESEAVGLDTSAARPVRVFENEDTLTLSSPYSVPAGGGSFSIAVRHSSLSTLGYAAKPVGLVRMDMIGTTGKTLASVVPSAVEYLGTAGGAAAGFVRYAVLPMLPAGMVVSAIRFAHRQVQRSGAAGVPSVWYDNLSFADTSVTSRHSLATVAITGAVRAPGSIAVKAPSTAALGNVLVLTTGARDQPATFMPACRVAGYQSAGSSDPATGLVALNATTSALGTTYTGLAVDVPLSSITSGAFELWLHATNSGSVTFAAQAQLVIGGVAVGPVVTTEGDTKASSSALRWVSAGRIELPSLPNPDSSAVVRIQFKVTAGSGAVDEVVLAPTTAAVTIAAVGNGTGSASGDSTRVWVDAPSTERIGGAWLRGVDDARTNARAVVLPDLVVPGRHVFAPRLMRIYVATPNVSGASSEISYYAQYHTRAAS
ncbi:unannotated protein [freshwater metagenome]|uniref:Unannotated protein n=1 Tax=freshwater metagenome TaxID=449393 RepID=A0A6J6S406_9ZZZZ